MLSNVTGYVTSPGYEFAQRYPHNYEGTFDLKITPNESVLISFINFLTKSGYKCRNDHLLITEIDQKKTYRICGWKRKIEVKMFRSSLRFYFYTDFIHNALGFKIKYTVLHRSQEPERLPSKHFNCSVPNFYSFKPVLNCNLLVECESGEDEQDCSYRHNECGQGEAIDAGTKCYSLVDIVQHRRKITWFDAHEECIQRGQRLATFLYPEEFTRYKRLMLAFMNLEVVYVGAILMTRLQPAPIEALYKNIWQWEDGRTAFSVQIHHYYMSGSCAYYDPCLDELLSFSCNSNKRRKSFVCEFHKQDEDANTSVLADIDSSASNFKWNVNVVPCPLRHVTRDFLSCDFWSDCDAPLAQKSCHAVGVTVPMFQCQESQSTVHYTQVCDHMQNCPDQSDEDFCKYPECPVSSLRCDNGQCISLYKQCNRKFDCYDGSDELCQPTRLYGKTFWPKGSIYLDGAGDFSLEQIKKSGKCPPSHFLCPRGFCLPVYLRCNSVDDCPGREDELSCDAFLCRGFYRCRRSKVCLHPKHMCDGVPQCPKQDDEMLCHFNCPRECRCQGLAFVCSSSFYNMSYLSARYLDASSSNVSLGDVNGNIHLITLHLSSCRISSLSTGMIFPNLRELDLSWNELRRLYMQHFESLTNLRVLVLKGNPLEQVAKSKSSGSKPMTLERIDLSRTNLKELDGNAFIGSPYIKQLNISWSKLQMIADDGFIVTPRLESLDLRGCRLTRFPRTLLRYLIDLKTVHAENFKLCCKAMLPINFDLKNCHATQDLLASCDDLIKSNAYHFFLWTFASLSVVGNIFNFGLRFILQQESGAASSFGVFVTNLSVADFFMGVYLAIIGTADIIYRGRYLWRDEEWKNSTACNIAGYLCLLSSETSAFIICLVTLDRFLCLRFPFSSLHFGRRSALAACGVVWLAGMALAIIPLLPLASHWKFYSQTGICIPLPFTSSDAFRGYHYSFGVSILLNMLLFLLIAAGQMVIYQSVRANSMVSSTNTRTRDATIARRLIVVVLSDFLCWFPIGLLGLLASAGIPVPGDLNVAVAIFALPVNSALNPFLYTFNLFIEKRKKALNEKLMKRLISDARSQQEAIKDTTGQTPESSEKSAAINQIKEWLGERLFSSDDILSYSRELQLGAEGNQARRYERLQ